MSHTFNNVNHVESGQDSWKEVNIFFPFSIVPSTVDTVGSGQNGASEKKESVVVVVRCCYLELSVVVSPAFAIEIVCCSIAS